MQPALGTASPPLVDDVVELVAPPAAELEPPSPAPPVVGPSEAVPPLPPLPPAAFWPPEVFVTAAEVLVFALVVLVDEPGPSTAPFELLAEVVPDEVKPAVTVPLSVPPIGFLDSDPSLLHDESATIAPHSQWAEFQRCRSARGSMASPIVTHAGGRKASHGLVFGELNGVSATEPSREPRFFQDS